MHFNNCVLRLVVNELLNTQRSRSYYVNGRTEHECTFLYERSKQQEVNI